MSVKGLTFIIVYRSTGVYEFKNITNGVQNRRVFYISALQLEGGTYPAICTSKGKHKICSSLVIANSFALNN